LILLVEVVIEASKSNPLPILTSTSPTCACTIGRWLAAHCSILSVLSFLFIKKFFVSSSSLNFKFLFYYLFLF
jgi:hypothetical protein